MGNLEEDDHRCRFNPVTENKSQHRDKQNDDGDAKIIAALDAVDGVENNVVTGNQRRDRKQNRLYDRGHADNGGHGKND